MDYWVEFYERTMGFTNIIHFADEQIHTEYSALMSKVMADGEGKIKFPINEPAEGKRKSQIEEYLEFFGGPGVQHIALQSRGHRSHSRDVAGAAASSSSRRPTRTTRTSPIRVGEIGEDWDDLRRLRILADRDEDGYLLQIFTKTAQDRPTLFFEVIERHGARGFGEGNFRRCSRRSNASKPCAATFSHPERHLGSLGQAASSRASSIYSKDTDSSKRGGNRCAEWSFRSFCSSGC